MLTPSGVIHVEVEDHTKCECECKVTEEDCNNEIHVYGTYYDIVMSKQYWSKTY